MSTTIAALVATLLSTGMTAAMSHELTLVGGSIATVIFASSIIVRRDASVYPAFLFGAILMVIFALVSSEANTSTFSSTIHVLSMYVALIGLACSSPDLSNFCQQFIMGTNLLLTVSVLYQGYGVQALEAWQIESPLGGSNIMAAQINMTIPLILIRVHESTGSKKTAYLMLICFNCIAVMLVMSRNGIGTLFIMLTLYVLFNYKRLAIFSMTTIISIGTSLDSIVQIPFIHHLLVKMRFIEFKASAPRSIIWQVAWDQIKHNPIFGVGPGGPQEVLARVGVYHAHNNFVHVALETGLPTAVIYTLLFLLLLWLPATSILQSRTCFVRTLPILAYFSYSLTAMPLACPGVMLLFAACVHEVRVAMQKQNHLAKIQRIPRQPGTSPRIAGVESVAV